MLSAEIYLGEFFHCREVSLTCSRQGFTYVSSSFAKRALGKDLLRSILPSSRGFFNMLQAGIHLGELFLCREVPLTRSRQGFT